MNDHDTQQLLQALLGLKQQSPTFYDKVVTYLSDEKQHAVDGVMNTSDPVQVAQLQGRYKALDEMTDLMVNTRDKLTEFEQQ